MSACFCGAFGKLTEPQFALTQIRMLDTCGLNDLAGLLKTLRETRCASVSTITDELLALPAPVDRHALSSRLAAPGALFRFLPCCVVAGLSDKPVAVTIAVTMLHIHREPYGRLEAGAVAWV